MFKKKNYFYKFSIFKSNIFKQITVICVYILKQKIIIDKKNIIYQNKFKFMFICIVFKCIKISLICF